jgi:hypothetical protein
MCPEDENENEKTPGPLLLVTRSSESEEDESFDLVWQRKLARRAEEKAEREKKRREKLERKLVKQSEENERLRWEVARAKRAIRTMAREIEKRGNSDDEKEEEEDEGNDHREEEMVAVLEKLAACDEDEDVSTSGETREGEGEQGKVMLVLDDEKDAEYFWSVNEDGRMNEDARPGRDRCVVVSAREEGFGKRENDDDDEEDFFSSERAQRVEQSKTAESTNKCEIAVYKDLDDDERSLLGGRDAMEIEPMRSSDCATHILLLLCEIVRFLRMECLPFDDDGDDYIGIEDTMTNGI